MTFKFLKTRIPDVVVIEPPVYSDARGFFMEVFKSSDFQAAGLPPAFTQAGYSRSAKHVVRGLHYQVHPKAQARLIRVTHGEIFDVAVDMRRSAPTYGQWVAAHLSSANNKMLFIPEGFAHGYCVLSDVADVMYFCTGEYAPDMERTVLWRDPAVGIAWPITDPVLSPKDAKGVPLSAAENNY